MSKFLSTALILALATTAGTVSAETIKYSTKDNNAWAGWHTSDDCSYSSVEVSASEYASRQTGSGPETGSYVGVFYNGTNWCTGEYTSGYAFGDGQVVAGAKNTKVTAELSGWDYVSGETRMIDVDLTFVANGEYSSRGMSNSTTTSGAVRTRSRSVGTSQSANVAGTITMDGVSLINGDVTWAGVGKYNQGSIEIYLPQ